jgi:hypothetical protein
MLNRPLVQKYVQDFFERRQIQLEEESSRVSLSRSVSSASTSSSSMYELFNIYLFLLGLVSSRLELLLSRIPAIFQSRDRKS